MTINSTLGPNGYTVSIPAPVSGGGGGLPESAAWSTTWNMAAQTDLGEQAVIGAMAITSDNTDAVIGGYTQAVVIANGTNIPTFDGQILPGWINTAGARNAVMLFRAGTSKFWTTGASAGAQILFSDFVRFSTLTNMSESGDAQNGYSYTTTSAANQVAKGSNLSLAADGYVEATVKTAGTSAAWLIGLDTNPSAITLYTGVDYAIYPRNTGFYQAFVAGGNATHNGSATVAITIGDKMRITRTGTTMSFDIIRAGTPINLHTITGVGAGTLTPVVTGINLSGVVQGPVSIAGGA